MIQKDRSRLQHCSGVSRKWDGHPGATSKSNTVGRPEMRAGRRLAKELLDWRPDILVANSTPSLVAARRATSTIPIVFIAIADPVAQGFVQSLAHPGGNITGFG